MFVEFSTGVIIRKNARDSITSALKIARKSAIANTLPVRFRPASYPFGTIGEITAAQLVVYGDAGLFAGGNNGLQISRPHPADVIFREIQLINGGRFAPAFENAATNNKKEFISDAESIHGFSSGTTL
ncbi:MAG: hypothetical protein R3C26_00535 [Calditrichia bacterium]